MASAIDGLSGLFTAKEPLPPAVSGADDSSRAFAGHLQQASRQKPETPRWDDTRRSSPESFARQSREQPSPPDTTPPDESHAAAVDAQAANHDEPPPVTDPSSIEKPKSDDERSTDEAAPATDPWAAVLQAAQVVVPPTLPIPQAELASHTEVATATSPETAVAVESVETTHQAAQVEALSDAVSLQTLNAPEVATVETSDQTEALPKVALNQQPASEPPILTPAQADSSVAVQPGNPVAASPLLQQSAGEKSAADAPSGTRRTEPDQESTSLTSEVTQVTAPHGSELTSTTVVASITPTQDDRLSDEQRSSRDQTFDTIDPGSSSSSLSDRVATSGEASAPKLPRFSFEKLTHPTTTNEGASTMTEAERVRFVQRIAKAVHTAVENGGPIRLRLSPPELGSMRIELRVAEGQMSVRVEAETTQARSALLDNLPALRERLEQQEIKITRFDVDLFGNSSGNLSQSSQREAQQETPLPRHQLRRTVGVESPEAPPMPSRAPLSADGRLNVVI